MRVVRSNLAAHREVHVAPDMHDVVVDRAELQVLLGREDGVLVVVRRDVEFAGRRDLALQLLGVRIGLAGDEDDLDTLLAALDALEHLADVVREQAPPPRLLFVENGRGAVGVRDLLGVPHHLIVVPKKDRILAEIRPARFDSTPERRLVGHLRFLPILCSAERLSDDVLSPSARTLVIIYAVHEPVNRLKEARDRLNLRRVDVQYVTSRLTYNQFRP